MHGGKTAPHCRILVGSALPTIFVASDFSIARTLCYHAR